MTPRSGEAGSGHGEGARELPTRPGAYRWYYFDLVAGDVTAVCIFMIGSLFSPRYASRVKKGANPQAHSAINFALYENRVPQQWVLSEYQQVSLEKNTLRIGSSSLTWNDDGTIHVSISERTPVWGKPAQCEFEFCPEVRGADAYQLVDGLPHYWHPYAPRGTAKLTLPLQNRVLEGRGYHDGNHGETPLGTDLEGWDWSRTHHVDSTHITYRPWHDGVTPLQVAVTAEGVTSCRSHTDAPMTSRTRWGLPVPRSLSGLPTSLLESSPFYARLEAGDASAHTVCEVADFKKFRSPLITWMAHFRTRVEAGR